MGAADSLASRALYRALEGWHDYYLLAGTAAVTFMGLLFVSLSLHLERVTHESGRHLEATAREAFSSFLIVLFVSLMMLIPSSSRRPLAFSLIAVGLIRGIQTLARIRVAAGTRPTEARRGARSVVLPFAFPIFGSAMLALSGVAIVRRAIDVGLALVMTACVFLIADAARTAYELLVGTRRSGPGEISGRG